MRVSLVFPPQGHFTQPYLSLPSLAAYLREHSDADVSIIDANIESYDHFLSGPRLKLAVDRVRAAERLDQLEQLERLPFSRMESYQSLSEIAAAGPTVAASIEEAKRVMRSPELFYDYERYLWAGRTIEQGLRLISAEFAPTKLTAHGFVMRYRTERSQDILDASVDESENPYIEYFREHVMPRLEREDPDLVGISVTFGAQAIPAITLARLVRAWKPSVHITLGGGLLAYLGEKLAKRDDVWGVIDSMVLLEGERPLLQLCEVVEGKRELADVTNLLWHDGEKLVVNPQQDPLDIQKLPPPDFDGLPLETYFSPELVLPLASTRGCYWGKCVFCTLYTVIGPGYRGRTVEQTVEDLAHLQEKYGARSFYLVIEDLPPNMAKRLPRAILDAGLDISWWTDARLEHDVFDQQTCDDLAAAGCKRIAFGYESANERVLEKMCKGIDPAASMELVQRVRNSGISVTLYVMVGFPTETVEEARETLSTLVAHRDLIQEVSIRVFYLDEVSEVFRRRDDFDISEIYPDDDADLQVYYDFDTSSGMSRAEARGIYLEFIEALKTHFPVFQNTNMLYHELKSHYFLYLRRHGSWEALLEHVLEPSHPGDPSADVALQSSGLITRALKFDRGRIDATLKRADSEAVRPRYQADVLREEDLVKFDGQVSPLAPEATELLYNPDSGELHTLSAAAASMLHRCDGTRTIEDVVTIVPAPSQEDARQCVRELAALGLVREASGAVSAE